MVTQLVITNLAIFQAIADEAYEEMVRAMETGRRTTAGGSGWIMTYDPHQTGFKNAMISIVFTGVWLELLLHLLIAKRLGEATFKKHDHKPYEEKLQLLGVTDKALLERVLGFRATRRELVHEKAYADSGEIKTAQREAEIAFEVRNAVARHLSSELEHMK